MEFQARNNTFEKSSNFRKNLSGCGLECLRRTKVLSYCKWCDYFLAKWIFQVVSRRVMHVVMLVSTYVVRLPNSKGMSNGELASRLVFFICFVENRQEQSQAWWGQWIVYAKPCSQSLSLGWWQFTFRCLCRHQHQGMRNQCCCDCITYKGSLPNHTCLFKYVCAKVCNLSLAQKT